MHLPNDRYVQRNLAEVVFVDNEGSCPDAPKREKEEKRFNIYLIIRTGKKQSIIWKEKRNRL